MKKKLAGTLLPIAIAFCICTAFNIKTKAADTSYVPNDNLMETYDVSTGKVTTEVIPNILPIDSPGFMGIGPIENEVDERPSTLSIIGKDDRVKITSTTSAPYRFIGAIEAFTNDKILGAGTGFLVSPKLVLTSARYVYDVTKDEYATAASFAPGLTSTANGNVVYPYGYANVKAIHIPTPYKESTKGDANYRKYDYALIELDRSIGNTTGYFGYRVNAVTYPNSVSVNVTGYDTDNYLHKGNGTGTMQSNNYLMNYTLDTSARTAGAPVYKSENGQYYAIGLHIGAGNGYNFGRLITDRILNAINKYK